MTELTGLQKTGQQTGQTGGRATGRQEQTELQGTGGQEETELQAGLEQECELIGLRRLMDKQRLVRLMAELQTELAKEIELQPGLVKLVPEQGTGQLI